MKNKANQMLEIIMQEADFHADYAQHCFIEWRNEKDPIEKKRWEIRRKDSESCECNCFTILKKMEEAGLIPEGTKEKCGEARLISERSKKQ